MFRQWSKLRSHIGATRNRSILDKPHSSKMMTTTDNNSQPVINFKTLLPPPTGIYVQTLPVLIPPTTSPSSSSEMDRKILLCKWASGDYKNRYTGLITKLSDDQFRQHNSLTNGDEKRTILRQIATDLLPSSLRPLVTRIDLVGLLRFLDPPVCDEYVYVANLARTVTGTLPPIDFHERDNNAVPIRFKEEHPCSWFKLGDIPFPQMPADDEVWYPKVLLEGKKVVGTFTFGGWEERGLKSYELGCVEEI